MTKASTIPTILPLFLLLFLFCGHLSYSQDEVVIKGTVLDSLEKTPLDSCQVFLSFSKNRLQTYTDSKGMFIFKTGLKADTILLTISRKNFQQANIKVPIQKHFP